MDDWHPIETAPKDGTTIEATHNRCPAGKWWPPYKTFWGVGKAHTVEDDFGNALDGYTVNHGRPCWIAEGGKKMAPTPTHWRPLCEALRLMEQQQQAREEARAAYERECG